MSYHFPNEGRRIESRSASSGTSRGAERSLAERRATGVRLVRKPEPIHRGILWVVMLVVLVVADNVFLDGGYRHMIVGWFTDMTAAIRHWSENVWD